VRRDRVEIDAAPRPKGRGWGGLLVLLLTGMLLAAPPARADDPVVPPQPADPTAAKAYRVLEQACAGCHQAGRLKGLSRPAASFGNVLDLATLARTPAYVVPGDPDGSPLYAAVHSRAMPPDGSADIAGEDLTAADLLTLRDWIEQLPPVQVCSARAPLTPAVIGAAVAEAATRLDPVRASTTRYISLAPWHNACASDAELEAARQALTVLLNGLSMGLEPIKLTPSGPSGVLLEFDLAAIGWDKERWDRLSFRAPAAAFIPIDAATRKALEARSPVVDGDWLADAATRAPLYYDLLGLPDTLGDLMATIRIDLGDETRGAVDRIGIKASAIARGNRLLERWSQGTTSAWLSREFAPTAGRPDLFDLAVAAAAAGDAARGKLQPDATLVHFDLPNGFAAYFAANGGGQRINEVPGSVLRSERHPSAAVQAAQGCLRCHSGPSAALARGRTDDLKARLLAETSLARDVRDRILAAHPDPSDFQRRIDEDQARLQRAQSAAGIDPTLQVEGIAPLPALIARYQRAVTLTEVAQRTGLAPQRVLELGKFGSASLADVVTRLAFGAVARSDVDAALPELASRHGLAQTWPTPGPTAPRLPSVVSPASSTAPELVFKAERPVYQSGDLLAVTVRANFPCTLTLLTLDAKGRATVLYPNEFEGAAPLPPNRETRIPGDKSPYQFRLRDKGQETLIATCSTGNKPVDGIHHDYEKQRFTELGDYRAYLARNWTPRPRTARKGNEAPEPVEPQARAAIRIRIE
jgi:mono/diheme cytochrome c family protein